MKKKILSLSIVMLLVLSIFALAGAVVSADSDDPNTIASSTMIFKGSLTDEGDGTYSGILPMVDEATESLGDHEAGFDIYARSGVKATYDTTSSGTSYACGFISYHDAYTSAGGWGTFYDPDCADWYNYQLRFAEGKWYMEYNANVGNDGILTGASAPPMSGTMDWVAMYAAETDAGVYYSGMGTPESGGYALNNGCTGINDGSAAWDMDWSWGSEYIPLQFPGFDVSMSEDGGVYTVTLVPAAMGSTKLKADVPDITAISVDPTSIDYGTLLPGQTSAQKDITVENVGTRTVTVDIAVNPAGTVFDYLELFKATWGTGPWDDFITGLAMGSSSVVPTRLAVPATYPPGDSETATLVFTATAE